MPELRGNGQVRGGIVSPRERSAGAAECFCRGGRPRAGNGVPTIAIMSSYTSELPSCLIGRVMKSNDLGAADPAGTLPHRPIAQQVGWIKLRASSDRAPLSRIVKAVRGASWSRRSFDEARITNPRAVFQREINPAARVDLRFAFSTSVLRWLGYEHCRGPSIRSRDEAHYRPLDHTESTPVQLWPTRI